MAKRSFATPEPTVAIVGGSIGGLTAAILLGQLDIEVRVFERYAVGDGPQGAGLGIDLDLLAAITGDVEHTPPHLRLRERRVIIDGQSRGDRVEIPVTAYHLLRDHLRERVAEHKVVAPQEVATVELHEVEPLTITFADGSRRRFDMLVGADGSRSVVRDAVVGEVVEPEYAGYVLWRGLIDEGELSDEARAVFFGVPGLHIAPHARQHFVAYPVPGADGAIDDGARRLNWCWYYGAAEERIEAELARVRGGEAYGVVASACSPEVRDDLVASAEPLWPAALHEVLERSLELDALRLHPVFESAAPRLSRSGAVLVGDAAHLASPITGAGARAAMYDALVLVRSLVDVQEIDAALGVYETRRLPLSRALVEQGRSVGWGFRLGRGRR
ncbi:MAG: FAD-dependent monooxygenase [Myxococcales bacterium]|nr:FAD-dependent monooxygenase [Myxococcales bacterium]